MRFFLVIPRTTSILNNVVLYGQDTSESIADYATGESLTAIGETEAALEAFYKLENYNEKMFIC